MKYNTQTVSCTCCNCVYTVSKSRFIIAARSQNRTISGWKNQTLSLFQRDDMASTLRPRTLLHQQ
ncbi:hypothetical protein BMETH_2067_0 [methanotrophic bacterial endosymbiont of Bathymodiolus sp.]|nr:hypothetical protein BMETH_2067_0 [methanotrophic bacterial endosymbiont of Bathymodiolus sp.]